MKKGFWNYTQEIEFQPVLVEVVKIDEPKTHWQNAFVGTVRQGVQCFRGNYSWIMDNEDGSGYEKIKRLGGPDSGHRDLTNCKIIEVQDDDKINDFHLLKYIAINEDVDNWQSATHPEEYKKLKALRETIRQMQANRQSGNHGRN
jgi:hypothetical protein